LPIAMIPHAISTPIGATHAASSASVVNIGLFAAPNEAGRARRTSSIVPVPHAPHAITSPAQNSP
jgi:hypothetical protein